ncbi:exocyst complex component 7-like, partial [Sinocyclocheilus rhinocerous]|uniref:exocyst complex component 7-like n=1 Tax=Sinocyclocheilus rhinocerous TaxID=307959 RepID=UPI0007B93943
ERGSRKVVVIDFSLKLRTNCCDISVSHKSLCFAGSIGALRNPTNIQHKWSCRLYPNQSGFEHDLRGVKHLSDDKHGAAAGKDDVLDIEIDSYIHCISAFVKLAPSEYILLTEIIPEHHQKKTFDSLIQEALDNLMLEGDNIISAARRAIMRHDYSAVLTIFPILRHLKQTKPDFDATLQGTAASTKNKLPALITSMETIGAKALEEFADSIKVDHTQPLQ